MADMTRGERTVQLFAKVILSEMDAGRYIAVDTVGRTAYYTSALHNAERLLFPNFENTMLHFVFLKRIASIYPATSEIIMQLLGRIEGCLPPGERKTLSQLGSELNTKILFMGTPPDIEEDASEKLRTVLQAIPRDCPRAFP